MQRYITVAKTRRGQGLILATGTQLLPETFVTATIFIKQYSKCVAYKSSPLNKMMAKLHFWPHKFQKLAILAPYFLK
jgi:hypothetical protein